MGRGTRERLVEPGPGDGETVLGLLAIPSPPPGIVGAPSPALPRRGKRGGGAKGSGPALLQPETVADLAAKGLNREEILCLLGVALPLPPGGLESLEAAIKRGRALGSATIKQAQFQAALEGKVSAQTRLLDELRDPEGGEGGEVEVVREIIGAGGEKN